MRNPLRHLFKPLEEHPPVDGPKLPKPEVGEEKQGDEAKPRGEPAPDHPDMMSLEGLIRLAETEGPMHLEHREMMRQQAWLHLFGMPAPDYSADQAKAPPITERDRENLQKLVSFQLDDAEERDRLTSLMYDYRVWNAAYSEALLEAAERYRQRHSSAPDDGADEED